MNTARLQFNIIYTPNTVTYLVPLVHSLLAHSDCSFQLVSNGCGPAETELLQRFCAQEPRLAYCQLAATDTLEHGTALDLLHEKCSADWFCFMDSDVFATGAFGESVREQLADCDVFSSGHPVWHAPEDITLPTNFRRWQGSYCASASGVTLGFSYFAAYRNAALHRVRAATNVGFGYRYWDDIAPELRAELQALALDKTDYDTGKLLLALMHARGLRLRTARLPTLVHLGGVSALADDRGAPRRRSPLDAIARQLASTGLARPLYYLADLLRGLRHPSPGLSAAQTAKLPLRERRSMQTRRRKRASTARYFTALLRSLQDDAPSPLLPTLGYRPAEQRVARAAAELRKLHAQTEQPAESPGAAVAFGEARG